jgi:hypothetical protein
MGRGPNFITKTTKLQSLYPRINWFRPSGAESRQNKNEGESLNTLLDCSQATTSQTAEKRD